MKSPKPIILLAVLLAAAGSFLATELQQRALASRISSGVYSLPAGNPVVTGTAVNSTVHNATMADIATEITNSLDRGGRGAMTAPLQHSSGTVSAPSITFSADPDTGLYRGAANDVRVTAGGVEVQKWLSGATYVVGNLKVDAGTVTVVSADNLSTTNIWEGYANNQTQGLALRYNSLAGVGSTSDIDIHVAPKGTGAVKLDGPTIMGSAGTSIAASYGGSFTIDFGSLTSSACAESAQTVTGAAVGGVCMVSTDSALTTSITYTCNVTAADTVRVRACYFGSGSHDPASQSYRVRVFQP